MLAGRGKLASLTSRQTGCESRTRHAEHAGLDMGADERTYYEQHLTKGKAMKVFARIDNDGLIIDNPETGERLVTFAWPEPLHLDNDEGEDEWDAINDQLPESVELTGGASSEVDSVTGEVFMVCEAAYYGGGDLAGAKAAAARWQVAFLDNKAARP